MASRAGRSLSGGRVPFKSPIDMGLKLAGKGSKGRKTHARGPKGRHTGQRRA